MYHKLGVIPIIFYPNFLIMAKDVKMSLPWMGGFMLLVDKCLY